MKKAHFIGISGIGMSALAVLLKNLGWEVSGSDDGFYPPASDYLKAHGISFATGYKKKNIPDNVELIVIGKNAKLTSEENDEVRAAFESGKTIRSLPEVLGGLIEEKRNIVVAGSYGKSTATALLAWCLLQGDRDPGYFIGAMPIQIEKMAHLGKDSTFVIEGDEYPASNWDSTSKFLYYHPHDILVTSARHDHINVFPTREEYLVPFKTLLSLIPRDGLLVANTDEENSRALTNTHVGKKVLYGLENPEAQWSAANISYGERTTFDLVRDKKLITKLETTLLGKHNIENIVGVSAMVLEKELLTAAELQAGIRTFAGVKRRLDRLSNKTTVPIYEGFGSSYEKQRAAMEAMQTHYPNRRLVVIFEPHTFSWRNRDTIHWYDSVFRGAHLVLVYEPAIQGSKTHKQLSQAEIVERIQAAGVTAYPTSNKEEALQILERELSEGDVVLISTSGDIGGLVQTIPPWLEQQFPLHEKMG